MLFIHQNQSVELVWTPDSKILLKLFGESDIICAFNGRLQHERWYNFAYSIEFRELQAYLNGISIQGMCTEVWYASRVYF